MKYMQLAALNVGVITVTLCGKATWGRVREGDSPSCWEGGGPSQGFENLHDKTYRNNILFFRCIDF